MRSRHIRCAGIGQTVVGGTVRSRQPDGAAVGQCPYCGREIAITLTRTMKAHKDLRSPEQRDADWRES